jgi:hypothetical protein
MIIRAEPTQYTLAYQPAGVETSIDLMKLSSMVLDGGSPAEYEFYFTGAHFGLFNQTIDGENCLCPAHFSWASFDDLGGSTVAQSTSDEIKNDSRVSVGDTLGDIVGRMHRQAVRPSPIPTL